MNTFHLDIIQKRVNKGPDTLGKNVQQCGYTSKKLNLIHLIMLRGAAYGNLDLSPDLKFALPLVDHFSSTFTTMWSTAREVAAGDVVIIWLVSFHSILLNPVGPIYLPDTRCHPTTSGNTRQRFQQQVRPLSSR